MKCPGCFQYMDSTSQLCDKCWEDYAQMVDEECSQMNEQSRACCAEPVNKKVNISSGEDACTF